MSLTYIIIGITVVVSIMCFNNRDLFLRLSLSPYDVVHRRQWYRVITHGFVHGDYMHLLINMLVLWSFGVYTESLFGSLESMGMIPSADMAFLLLYFGALIFASVPDVFKYKDNMAYRSVGASGAVSAIIFTTIFFAPWNKIYLMAIVPIPGILFGVAYLWYCQYANKRSRDNINHMAHFYGAVFGFFFPLILKFSLIHVFLENITNFNG